MLAVSLTSTSWFCGCFAAAGSGRTMSLPVICYRVATGADAGQMAAVQIAAWRDSFAGFVPQQLLLALDHPLLATALQSQ